MMPNFKKLAGFVFAIHQASQARELFKEGLAQHTLEGVPSLSNHIVIESFSVEHNRF
jgi:hypothetical protein